MNISNLPVIGMLFIAGSAVSSAAPKTLNPVKVVDNKIVEEPYRYNGLVLTKKTRGSGFCAWNRRVFFSAAHVVYNDKDGVWKAPPLWNPANNGAAVDTTKSIQSRGYFRWTDYAEIVSVDGNNGDAFGRDVIVGFAFEPLIKGTPATLNLSGGSNLKSGKRALITGYPAVNAYTNEKISGYFLHQTGPGFVKFATYSGDAIETTLISTGPGNSGGPVWTSNGNSTWSAAGVLVGGLPSESIVYGFSSDVNSLTRAAYAVVKPDGPQSLSNGSVSSDSRFYSYTGKKVLPDGSHDWTDFRFNASGFEIDELVTKVRISMKVKTTHRGDILAYLEGPGGYGAYVHKEEGADADNLIIVDKNVSKNFVDIEPTGQWTLHVADRLKGDTCTVESVILEIVSKGPDLPPVTPEP